MRVVSLPDADGRARGHAHGETFRPLVRELAELRCELAVRVGGFASMHDVLALAGEHLPVLREFDFDLYEELLGIAEGAALSPEHVVVLNHYTDLRDLGPLAKGASPKGYGPEGCSALLADTREGVILAQTWDMHGSALPYVALVEVPRGPDRPAAWVFTLIGCLGMTGLNEHGVGITINNLTSTDATVGVVWPLLVRRVLTLRTAREGRDGTLSWPIGSGHHYLVASHEDAYGVETSGTERDLVFDGGPTAYAHTNHPLGQRVGSRTIVAKDSTTFERQRQLEQVLPSLRQGRSAHVWTVLGSHEGYPRSVCAHMATVSEPHASRTCGAILMNLSTREVWAESGCVHESRPQVFGF